MIAGIHFLRTSLNGKEEQTLWAIYNVIREIESTFYAEQLVMQSGTNKIIENQVIPYLSLQYHFA